MLTDNDKQEELKYLKKVKKEINEKIKELDDEYYLLKRNKRDFSEHFSEDFYTMDDEEQAQEGEFFNDFDSAIEHTEKQIERLNKIKYSPYFGRIDFKENGNKKAVNYYIGVNNVVSKDAKVPLVCDWRAPVSSLFYDYELGDGKYFAPDGEHCGNIQLKRQFKIKNGEIKIKGGAKCKKKK